MRHAPRLVDIFWRGDDPHAAARCEVSPIAGEKLDDLLTPKPVLQASLFCKSVYPDTQGRLTILDAFWALPRGPAPEFVLVNLWRHDVAQSTAYRELLETRDPDGRVLGALQASPFLLGGEAHSHFSCTRFTAVNLTASGAHEVRIFLADADSEAIVATEATPLYVF